MSGEALRRTDVDQSADSYTVSVEYNGQIYEQRINKGDPLVWRTQYGDTKWIIESVFVAGERGSETGFAYVRCIEDGLLDAPNSQGPLPVRKDERMVITSKAAGIMILQQEEREIASLLGTSG